MTTVLVVNDGVALAGTLALPPTETPCRGGVVMVGGSGPADRDNDWLFPPIRQHLVNAGIAVFSYDKRGVGESTGSWLTPTLDDLAADCAAALTFPRR
jgi:pimeloyl-ACP methyl ester carboxylesterase